MFLLAAGATLTACHRDADPQPPVATLSGQELYPIAIGRYWVFAVEEHFWDLNTDSTVQYLARERIDTTYRNATGELTYRVVRSRRPDTLHLWRDDSVFALNLSGQSLRRTANNRPQLELVFPVRAGAAWNANQLIAGPTQARTYGPLNEAFMADLTGVRYDSTVSVVDDIADNSADLIQRRTVYARRIGPVYRRRQRLRFCNTEEQNQQLCTFGEQIRSAPPLYYVANGTERYETLLTTGTR